MAGGRSNKKSDNKEKLNRWLTIIGLLYLVCIVLIVTGKNRELAMEFVWIPLLLSTIPLFIYHKGYGIKLVGFTVVSILGLLLLEIISINFYHFFGVTQYKAGMGFQIFKVPPVKILLWFGFIYSSCILVNSIKSLNIYKALMIGFLTLGIDIIVERTASSSKGLNLWTFGDYGVFTVPIPLFHYCIWGVVGALLGFYFVSVFYKTRNNYVLYFMLINLFFFLSFYFTMPI